MHTDYLGKPRYIMDNANNLLWKWENLDPYGTNTSQGTLEFNLRFAGQYYDSESGLHYNVFRMYDPNSKRYMQSDPLNLAAGYNTYNYVGRNPINYTDRLGLDVDIFLGSSGLGDSKNTASPGHLGLGVTGFDGKIWHNLPGAGLVKGDFLESKNFKSSIGIEGFMNLLPDDTLFYIRIKTTKEQDEKIIEYLNKEWKKSKEYVPIFNDCVTFVKNALSYAGINYSHNLFDYSKTPYGVFNDIKNNNEVLESGQMSSQSLGNSNYNKNLLDNMLRGKL